MYILDGTQSTTRPPGPLYSCNLIKRCILQSGSCTCPQHSNMLHHSEHPAHGSTCLRCGGSRKPQHAHNTCRPAPMCEFDAASGGIGHTAGCRCGRVAWCSSQCSRPQLLCLPGVLLRVTEALDVHYNSSMMLASTLT